jgi:hypothetical protein
MADSADQNIGFANAYMTGNLTPEADGTRSLGSSTYGFAHLYLGGVTGADIHAGVDVAFRNMADSAYQNIDVLALKVGGTSVIDSSRNLANVGTMASGTHTVTGNVVPEADNTRSLGSSTYGFGHLYLGAATSADIHSGIDVAFRNMADSAYQNIDALSLKIGGTTVINSSGIVSNQVVAINFVIDGGGSAITTGSKGFLEVPFAMTITGWTIVADVSGSIVVDVNRATYAAFDPATMASIAGTELPTISSALKGQDLSLSSWTTSLAAGNILEFEVDSASTVTKATVSIRGTRA